MRENLAKKQPVCRVGHLTFDYWPGFTANLTIAGESVAVHSRSFYKVGVYLHVKGASSIHMEKVA